MTPERWKQIEDLYLAAMDLTANERAALLAQANPDVREEVENLLAEPSGSKLLDWSVGAHEKATRSTIVATGTRVGQYQIESFIGAGGMGVVYRALDTKLNRPVAVKFLSGELADAAARRRFQREAQTASSLKAAGGNDGYGKSPARGPDYLRIRLCRLGRQGPNVRVVGQGL